MAVKLNETAFEYARQLVTGGKVVADERDAWSEHQPSAQQENEFIQKHGFGAYTRWHLGTDDSEPADRKAHYKFPYGDFENVHRCGVLAAEAAGRYGDAWITDATCLRQRSVREAFRHGASAGRRDPDSAPILVQLHASANPEVQGCSIGRSSERARLFSLPVLKQTSLRNELDVDTTNVRAADFGPLGGPAAVKPGLLHSLVAPRVLEQPPSGEDRP
jgi:hypothetical protein